jgi:hypothetical protein
VRGAPPSSRSASATSASATTQRARASGSCAPKPRAALRSRSRARQLAELRHRDAAQGQRRRVVAQRYALERAERVTRGQCAPGGGDEGVHGRG